MNDTRNDSRPQHTDSAARTRRRRQALVLAALVLLLALESLGGLELGAVRLDVGGILLHDLTGVRVGEWESWQPVILWQVRMPRVLLGVLVGGGLALAGAVMQGVFRNPMADPG